MLGAKKGFGMVQIISILGILFVALLFFIFASLNSASSNPVQKTASLELNLKNINAIFLSSLKAPVTGSNNLKFSNPTIADLIVNNPDDPQIKIELKKSLAIPMNDMTEIAWSVKINDLDVFDAQKKLVDKECKDTVATSFFKALFWKLYLSNVNMFNSLQHDYMLTKEIILTKNIKVSLDYCVIS